MNILVLAAGRGQRFKDEGYTTPKPLIGVKGLPMIVRCTDSLTYIVDDVLRNGMGRLAIAYLDEEGDQTENWEYVKKTLYCNEADLIKFDELTQGNLQTASKSVYALIEKHGWDWDVPLLILDADNIYNGNALVGFLDKCNEESDEYAALCYFDPIDRHDHWCFADVDGFRIRALAEKNELARAAGWKPVLGTFYFSSARLFLDAANEVMQDGWLAGDEFYMSQAYEHLLKNDVPVYGCMVDHVRPVGTPADLRRYERGKLIVAIDLDDTINRCKRAGEKYGNELPQEHAIEILKMWKRRGYYIIINTARHMNTCAGNQGKVLARQGLTTLQWLEDNEVPYDEIWWSKPHADVFIDDKAFRHKIDNWDRTADWIDKFAQGEVK